MRKTYIDDMGGERSVNIEFWLTYDGLLSSTRGKAAKNQIDSKWEHKHHVRQCFHDQLKNLWEQHPVLKRWLHGHPVWTEVFKSDSGGSLVDQRARQYPFNGFNFVPLVIDGWAMVCSLEIVYLRQGAAGNLFENHDIDNRIKTLIDALKMPSVGELGEIYSDGSSVQPTRDQKPFFALLENDSLVTKLTVDADTLLAPTGKVPESQNSADSRVFIKVKCWSYDPGIETEIRRYRIIPEKDSS